MAMRFKPLLSVSAPLHQFNYYCPQPISYFSKKSQFRIPAAKMATTSEPQTKTPSSQTKIIDSHLHVWASPQEVKPLSKHFRKYYSCFLEYLEWVKFCFFIFFFLKAADKYPYFPGQEPTLPGNVDFLLEVCLLFNLYVFFCLCICCFYFMIFWW